MKLYCLKCITTTDLMELIHKCQFREAWSAKGGPEPCAEREGHHLGVLIVIESILSGATGLRSNRPDVPVGIYPIAGDIRVASIPHMEAAWLNSTGAVTSTGRSEIIIDES